MNYENEELSRGLNGCGLVIALALVFGPAVQIMDMGGALIGIPAIIATCWCIHKAVQANNPEPKEKQ